MSAQRFDHVRGCTARRAAVAVGVYAETLLGLLRAQAGEVRLNEKPLGTYSIREAKQYLLHAGVPVRP